MAKVGKRGATPNIALEASKQREFNQTVKKIQDKDKKGQSASGVVYISHLPWGFEEKPLREYFKQFGVIKQLRLSRSKKTGNPRGFAYIQFRHDEVAKIVAETMNNYLMFGKLIKCKHLQNPHPQTFKNAKRPFIKQKRGLTAIAKHNSKKSGIAVEKSQKRMLGKLAKLEATLASQGIEYKLDDPRLNRLKISLKAKHGARKRDRVEEKMIQDKRGEISLSIEKEIVKNSDKITSDDDDEEEYNDVENVENKDIDDGGKDIDSDDDNDDYDDDDDDEKEYIDENKVENKDSDVDLKDVVSDDDDDTDDEEEDENVEVCEKVIKTQAKKQKGKKTTDSDRENSENKLLSSNRKGKKSDKKTVIKNVLTEDSSDDEISFKTPPSSVKSPKVDKTVKSLTGTPVTGKKSSPKRKLDEKVMKTFTPEPGSTGKKIKLNPGRGQEKDSDIGSSKKDAIRTPKNSDRLQMGKKTPSKKTLLSATKLKQLKK